MSNPSSSIALEVTRVHPCPPTLLLVIRAGVSVVISLWCEPKQAKEAPRDILRGLGLLLNVLDI